MMDKTKKPSNKKKMYSYGGMMKKNMGGPVSTKGSQPQYGKTIKDAMPKSYEC